MIQIGFIIPESMQLFYNVGTIGFIISFILAIVFYFRKNLSTVATTYMIGAVATFYFGGFTITYSIIIPMCPCYVTWTHPFGLIGGYALILVAFVQYWYDKKKSIQE
ncbi:MAG: hypothetical protein ACFFEV_07310 [Candidatus Thorarchaeota archaeon]